VQGEAAQAYQPLALATLATPQQNTKKLQLIFDNRSKTPAVVAGFVSRKCHL
jgi:hypothetical protein